MVERIAASEDTFTANIMMSIDDDIETKYRDSLEDDSATSFPVADVPKRKANGEPILDTARLKNLKKVKKTSTVDSTSTTSSTVRDTRATSPVSKPISSKFVSPHKK